MARRWLATGARYRLAWCPGEWLIGTRYDFQADARLVYLAGLMLMLPAEHWAWLVPQTYRGQAGWRWHG